MGRNPDMPYRKASLLKRQKGICPWCCLRFREGDLLEIDHKIPRALGGKDEYKNLQLLHGHCHDDKTALDLESIRNQRFMKYMENVYQTLAKHCWCWDENDLLTITS
ncbi:HNH endonuclease [Waterburya agarophytonicola K14]|uniref:HNH endonuclease n=1 Tax=Waterburya agarophytonicola KI4 TaxID=2874699 RepID=A0A964BTH2_9CYAN|nr:HNH endonuclease signature motif containing protein [Waterburya agarophytonicola]MCC0177560.1 HNH endonuclease [Waterburya agarophytonicola KI4]